jgi:hypothetical protein
MAQYQVKDPQGTVHIIEGPDGATPDQVMMAAQQMAAAHQATVDRIANDPITKGAQNFNGDSSFLGNAVAGFGKAFSDAGQGIGQLIPTDLHGGTLVSRADVAESRKLDAPLMKTGGGKVGNFAGNAAMAIPATAAAGASIPAAAGVGAVMGLIQPSVSTGETAANVGLGAVGSAGGQYVANKLGGVVAKQQADNALQAALASKKNGVAKMASDAGYALPLEDIGNPSLMSRLLSGVGGKIKTAQTFSERNQGVTNSLAASEIGLPVDMPITREALDDVRSEAGKAYAAVANLGKLDAAGANLPAQAGAKFTTDPLTLTKSTQVDAKDLVQAWKQANHDSIGYLRAYGRDANPETLAKSKAAGDVANKVSDFLTTKLQQMGLGDQAQALKDARVMIAKTYNVEDALNPATGDINAAVFGRALKNDKPLTGNFEAIANANLAFPKATQMLKEAPKTWSPLDMAYAAKNLGTGNIKGLAADAATLGLRPAARSIMLSGPMQRSAIANAGKPASANLLARIMANNELMLPAGVATGNALSAQLAR